MSALKIPLRLTALALALHGGAAPALQPSLTLTPPPTVATVPAVSVPEPPPPAPLHLQFSATLSPRPATARIPNFAQDDSHDAPAWQADPRPTDAAPVAPQQWLLHQVWIGEATHNEALIDSALLRLARLAADDPDVQYAQLQQALRRKDIAAAEQTLAHLHAAPNAQRQARRAAVLMRLQGADQAQLQQALLLQTAGRHAEAVATFEQLFGNDPPTFTLALTYWSARAELPRQRPEAIRQLQALDQRAPDNSQLRQTLVGLLFAENRNAEALAMLGQLAQDPYARAGAAQREFDYWNAQPVTARSVAGWQRFLQRYMGTPLYSKGREALHAQQQQMADPAWRARLYGATLLAQGRNAEAITQFRYALTRYPQEAALHGDLGYAHSRSGNHAAALAAFTEAARTEQHAFLADKWQSLIRNSRFWALLSDAEQAVTAQDAARATALYEQARRVKPAAAEPLIGLAQLALAQGRNDQAQALFERARAVDPDSNSAIRGLVALYREQQPERAQALLDGLPQARRAQLQGLIDSLETDRLNAQADDAEQRGDGAALLTLLQRLHALQPDAPWTAWRVAHAQRAQGDAQTADAGFAAFFQSHADDPSTRYAYALYLASIDDDAQALTVLQAVAPEQQTEAMQQLAERLTQTRARGHAQALHAQGRTQEAEALLLGLQRADADLTVAEWARERDDPARALALYEQVLAREPDNTAARLGVIELLIEDGQTDAARHWLADAPPQPQADQLYLRRRLAHAHLAVGNTEHAAQTYAALNRDAPGDVLTLRDTARLAVQRGQWDEALDSYAQAMAFNRQLTAEPHNHAALTAATRAQDDTDWLTRSLRSDVDALYHARSTIIEAAHQYGWRNDSTTSGVSALTRAVTMLDASTPLTTPLGTGRGWARIEQVELDAGRFAADPDGLHRASFGSCALQWQALGASAPQPAGCLPEHARAQGTTLAVGWRDAQWAFDLGHSPLGFTLDNWLGGAAYRSRWADWGYTVTASRRPMDSTLLSYAGAQDPASGARFGGVTANGISLNLSRDRGERSGVWALLQHHWLLGDVVPDNRRTRLMSGVYVRLLERANEQVRIGATAMLWWHQKNLGQYTLGHGGYYSPQQYASLGVPLRWSRRTADWSWDVQGSIGWSTSRSDDSALYPTDVLQRVLGAQADPAQFALVRGNLTQSGGRSHSFGWSLQGGLEHRLTDHWTLGGQLAYQRSPDYAPSTATLYLRYWLQPWQGNLPLPVEPLVPYATLR
ncbi:cellulose synthase complex outer membrane protein BcsC [Sinimarinibacterium sp. NLF-5-8]|uniref:cellulose synthase complex outer membrane protein BcsC n=1 Tax=Sinimarinibacterium sp. NLF-5-8 TaxID=2698684 RepID=UPI00137C0B76|nr:cellulose synthase complex outer membrane protein BcsC [Sinimarinibacterium sp. NLF-5-8]QHS08820.1 cellulose biosynthesis protein BcsC [Sinimarinibacterium sp. NLF-5-8]